MVECVCLRTAIGAGRCTTFFVPVGGHVRRKAAVLELHNAVLVINKIKDICNKSSFPKLQELVLQETAPPRLRRTPLPTRFHALRVVTSPAAPSSFTQTFHKPPIAPHNYTIMASAAKKKLVVCGGNGFLGKQHPQQPPASTQITANTPSSGSRICKAAAHRGWAVTSISRSGTPHWSSVSSSANPPDWSTSVSWQKGDVLDPASYTQHLDGADAVIHSMGILLEADYKGVVSGRESPIKGLQRAFSSKKQGTQNPLEGKGGEKLRPMESDGQLTYEVMNRDTGMFCMQGLFGF
jgi:hypothetical protein